jgi:hypothetical protein
MATIISEFSAGSDGRHFTGTCTQSSAAMALMMADKTRNQSYQGGVNLMIAMRDAMFARGECSANGASTIANMAKEMRNRGADVAAQINYGGDYMGFDWISFIRAHGGEFGIVLQLAKTYNLKSVNSWNTNVGYHAICILGKQTNGYIVGDPNRPAGNTEPVIYSIQALQAASPCGLIGIRPKSVVVPNPIGGNKLISLPSGWEEKGTGDAIEWYGPASPLDGIRYPVSHGILYFLRNNNWRGGTPIGNISLDSDGIYRQVWLDFIVQWQESKGGSWFNVGVDWIQKQRQIADLQNQITALQAQLNNQQPDPKAVSALVAIKKLKEAMA